MLNFIDNLDINKNELQNTVIHQLANAPSNPKKGQIYYNTTNNKTYIYNGTNWIAYQEELVTTATGTLSIDPTPTSNSSNLVTSGGVYNALANVDSLPSQTGQSGKYLTTDGTDASWATVNSLPDQTSQSGKFLTTDGTDASWGDPLPSQTSQSGKFLTTNGTSASWSSITHPTEVYLVAYGTTTSGTFTNVANAYNQGKLVVADLRNIGGGMAPLYSYSSSQIRFIGFTTANSCAMVTLRSTNAWSYSGSTWVLTSRKINGKSLSSDVTLTPPDIGSAPNRNLLDNSFFTVNQRGQSTYTGAGYTVDRWRIPNSRTSVAVNSGYITLSTDSSGNGLLVQKLSAEYSQQVTFSAYIKGTGTGLIDLLDSSDTQLAQQTFEAPGDAWTLVSLTYSGETAVASARFRVDTSGQYDIKCAKLELGSASTLAYDTTPDYGEELTRCIYSTANTDDTYANNGFGRTNPNLLDNPWFKSGTIINQRSSSTYADANTQAYWFDRWQAKGSLSIGATGITTSAPSILTTFFEEDRIISGRTYTLSALFADGTMWKGTSVVTTSSGATNWVCVDGTVNTEGCGIRHYSSARPWQVVMWFNSVKTVVACKLELGSYSTLANDVPPDYASELDKCRYYFERISAGSSRAITLGYGYPDGYNTLYAHFKINPKRSTSPSLVTGSSFVVGDGTGMSTAVSSASVYNFTTNGYVTVALTATGAFSPPNLYRFGIPANGYVDFSADL